MAEAEMEQALRQPLGNPHLQLFPHLCENAESSSIVFGAPMTVDKGIDPTVMKLLEDDEKEIDAGRSFTQCDRIKESNCIHHSQYIQLLRKLRHNHLLDSYENNVDKRLVDIKPYVLLLQRLPSKLVQHYPKNDTTRDPICTYSDPSYCLLKDHLHLCPYAFLKALGDDLLCTKLIVGAEDPSDDMGLYVRGDLDMYIDNLQRVVDMLQRRV